MSNRQYRLVADREIRGNEDLLIELATTKYFREQGEHADQPSKDLSEIVRTGVKDTKDSAMFHVRLANCNGELALYDIQRDANLSTGWKVTSLEILDEEDGARFLQDQASRFGKHLKV